VNAQSPELQGQKHFMNLNFCLHWRAGPLKLQICREIDWLTPSGSKKRWI